jgi:hypothetical protein
MYAFYECAEMPTATAGPVVGRRRRTSSLEAAADEPLRREIRSPIGCPASSAGRFACAVSRGSMGVDIVDTSDVTECKQHLIGLGQWDEILSGGQIRRAASIVVAHGVGRPKCIGLPRGPSIAATSLAPARLDCAGCSA